MVDRFTLTIYARELMPYYEEVREVISNKDVDYQTALDGIKYEQYELEQLFAPSQDPTKTKKHEGENIDLYLPSDFKKQYSQYYERTDLDDKLDYMETRSITQEFNLTQKPQIKRDGRGWCYMWTTQGFTYRFNHKPVGKPVSLQIYGNMQRLAYVKLLEKFKEYDRKHGTTKAKQFKKDYQADLIDETNFIPKGYESEYLKIERSIFLNLAQGSIETYKSRLSWLGFTEEKIKSLTITPNLSQCEICYNDDSKIGQYQHLRDLMDDYFSCGLRPTLHTATPLFVTKYNSPIDPTYKQYSHKIYQKTRSILRQEIVIGNDLKNNIDLAGSTEPLGHLLFHDPETFKRYIYVKLYFRHSQIEQKAGKKPQYELWKNGQFDHDDTFLRRTLQATLNDDPELEKCLKDIELFDKFVDLEGSFKRRFFPFSPTKFKNRLLDTGYVKRLTGPTGHRRHGHYEKTQYFIDRFEMPYRQLRYQLLQQEDNANEL